MNSTNNPQAPGVEVPINFLKMTSEEVSNAAKNAINLNYDMKLLKILESRYMGTELSLPAIKNDDIPDILGIIEQITGGTRIEDIRSFLDNTSKNSTQSRTDLQRCGAILQKISGIQDESINWNLIFSCLQLKEKREAA